MNNRIFKLKSGITGNGDIIYWMSRDQRVQDNWALINAYNVSVEKKTQLHVVFALCDNFLGAELRQYAFMIKGLKEICQNLSELNIHFNLLIGEPTEVIADFINKGNFSEIYTDFDPLRIKRQWKKEVADKIHSTMIEVDAHNIVPCRLASDKIEFAAYTIRKKITGKLNEYLIDFPIINRHPFNKNVENIFPEINYSKYGLFPTESLLFIPGETAAINQLDSFIKYRLIDYCENRNFPELNLQSNLSPYLHFGHISAQRIALKVLQSITRQDSKDAFLEELIIRRELADNFCFYNPDYDKYEGFHDWAKKSLSEHLNDKREYIYCLDQFENSETHDIYWNSAQSEMVKTGKMHGYMRMYWAKKILEWTESPFQALEYAIYLNDKYLIDGRDPNGYAGIAWSIGGVHDRAWSDRPVYGKIRYMNEGGLKRKFDIDKYVMRVKLL